MLTNFNTTQPLEVMEAGTSREVVQEPSGEVLLNEPLDGNSAATYAAAAARGLSDATMPIDGNSALSTAMKNMSIKGKGTCAIKTPDTNVGVLPSGAAVAATQSSQEGSYVVEQQQLVSEETVGIGKAEVTPKVIVVQDSLGPDFDSHGLFQNITGKTTVLDETPAYQGFVLAFFGTAETTINVWDYKELMAINSLDFLAPRLVGAREILFHVKKLLEDDNLLKFKAAEIIKRHLDYIRDEPQKTVQEIADVVSPREFVVVSFIPGVTNYAFPVYHNSNIHAWSNQSEGVKAPLPMIYVRIDFGGFGKMPKVYNVDERVLLYKSHLNAHAAMLCSGRRPEITLSDAPPPVAGNVETPQVEAEKPPETEEIQEEALEINASNDPLLQEESRAEKQLEKEAVLSVSSRSSTPEGNKSHRSKRSRSPSSGSEHSAASVKKRPPPKSPDVRPQLVAEKKPPPRITAPTNSGPQSWSARMAEYDHAGLKYGLQHKLISTTLKSCSVKESKDLLYYMVQRCKEMYLHRGYKNVRCMQNILNILVKEFRLFEKNKKSQETPFRSYNSLHEIYAKNPSKKNLAMTSQQLSMMFSEEFLQPYQDLSQKVQPMDPISIGGLIRQCERETCLDSAVSALQDIYDAHGLPYISRPDFQLARYIYACMSFFAEKKPSVLHSRAAAYGSWYFTALILFLKEEEQHEDTALFLRSLGQIGTLLREFMRRHGAPGPLTPLDYFFWKDTAFTKKKGPNTMDHYCSQQFYRGRSN